MALDSGSSSTTRCDLRTVVTRDPAAPDRVTPARAIQGEKMAFRAVAPVLVFVVDCVHCG